MDNGELYGPHCLRLPRLLLRIARLQVQEDLQGELQVSQPHRANLQCTSLNYSALALDIIRRSRRKKFVIFSDSLSGLLAIRNCQLETGYVQKFIINYCQLVNAGNSITLIWIPGHTGI